MKKYYSLLLILVSTTMFSQLFVGTNGYVYNKGSMVFVNQDVNLQSNGNVYLRNEGQLLQGTTVASTNVGLGKLSVFQEGTVNNYAYNYWCSPIGNASNAVGNESFGVGMINTPTAGVAVPVPATILASSINDGISTPLSIASRWIYKFLSSTTYSQWFFVGSASTIGAGEGFTMKGTSGTDATNVGETVVNNPGSAQRYDFSGKPNDGNIAVSVTTGTETLTGNPYPSAIDLNSFLTDPANSNIDGTALFWEHDKTVNSHLIALYRGGYGVYNGTTSIYTPATFYTYDGAGIQGSVYSNPMNVYQRRFSPIGQGFMVRGVGNGTVQMKNAYRVFVKEGVVNNSQFERTADETASIDYGFYDSIVNVAGVDYTQISMAPTPHFIVNTSLNNQAVRQIAIGFMPTATDGIDRADSKFPEDYDSMVADMYLVLNDTPFVHSITNFDITKRFPIGFKNATTGNFTYTMKVNDFVNFEADNVYLFDYETGLYHDIKNSVYDVVLAPGIYNNRFEITFTNDALGTEEAIKENLVIVQNNTNHLLSVSNPNAVEIKSAALYDIVGKQIFNEVNLGTNSSYSFSTANLSEGVYIVKLATPSHKNIGQKIIVKK